MAGTVLRPKTPYQGFLRRGFRAATGSRLGHSMRLSLVDQTKIVTAASELGRNTLEHGGGGELRSQKLSTESAKGSG